MKNTDKNLNGFLENEFATAYEECKNISFEIDPDIITDFVMKNLDPEMRSIFSITWLARLECRKRAGRWLSTNFDPIVKANDAIGMQMDAFSDELQERYPCKRLGNDGELHTVYVERNHMTDLELIAIADRMEKHAKALVAHAKNIKAFMRTRTRQA